MVTRSFMTQHRHEACDRTGEPQQDVNPHNGQKHRISRGYIDPRETRRSIAHAISRQVMASRSPDIIPLSLGRSSGPPASLTDDTILLSLDIWNRKEPF